MKEVFLKSKILLFLAVLFSICLKANPSQASTLILQPSQINKLISKTGIFQNRIKLYRDRSIPEIIERGNSVNNFASVLEQSPHIYNQKTSIELLALPEVSQISKTKAQSAKLLSQLGNSLSRISWNKNTVDNYNSIKQSSVLLLPQADSGDIYRNIYDFEISLLDDNYIEQPEATNKNATTINEVEVDSQDTDNNLRRTQVSKYDPNYTNQFSFGDRLPTKSVDFQLLPRTSSNNTPQNNLTDLVDSSSEEPGISTQQSTGSSGNIDVAKYQIDLQSSVGKSFNIPRTKEQQELDRKLAEQKRQLEQQRKELRRKLEQERKERARKRQQEARKLEQERQEKLRQARQQQQQMQKQLQQSLFSR